MEEVLGRKGNLEHWGKVERREAKIREGEGRVEGRER